MNEEQMESAATPAAATTCRKCSKVWMIAAIILLITSIALGAMMFMGMTDSSESTMMDDESSEEMMDEAECSEEKSCNGDFVCEEGECVAVVMDEEMEGELKTREFGLINEDRFEYIDGWHISSQFIHDNANRTRPEIYVKLSPEPIVLVSPTGPRGFTITIWLLDEGEEYVLPEQENFEIETDTMVVGGKEAVRHLITRKEDVLAIPYEEVLIVDGYVFSHEYSDISEANEPAWKLFKDTLELSN